MKKFKPILFSTPMVQAILYGRKTQTRRTIKPQPQTAQHGKVLYKDRELTINSLVNHAPIQKGDILWVRETFKLLNPYGLPQYKYKADWDTYNTGVELKWKPGVFMPKSASRIFLSVVGVRVERLQDISDTDAIAEGVEQHSDIGAIWSFQSLWESINGQKSWTENPWVWVYDFKRIEKPENFM